MMLDVAEATTFILLETHLCPIGGDRRGVTGGAVQAKVIDGDRVKVSRRHTCRHQFAHLVEVGGTCRLNLLMETGRLFYTRAYDIIT